ncbi:MAG: SulP family inorganic anion transporter [Verrucomicrobia bacterium]|nr:MAG: SulP family inorganic anion transporter [Verrucomicrobiota bacterium]
MSSPSPADHAARVINQAGGVLSDAVDYLRIDPVPPIWRELRRYSVAKAKADAAAAAMVAIVTIPQAIGFALVVGLPAAAVITTAIVGGIFCALFSASRHLVFGPTNTISIILAGALLTVRDVPLTPLQKVLVIGFLIGLIQLCAGFFKLGTLTQFISRTVIVAYACAVAVLIAVGQVGNLFGIGAADSVSLPALLKHLLYSIGTLHLNPMSAAVGVASLAGMLLIRRLRPTWPEGLIVIALSALVAVVYRLSEFEVLLVRDAGALSANMPLFVGFPSNATGIGLLPVLFSVALAAAILGMLEATTITKSLATRSGQRLNPNRELIAMGAGNLAATAFGAMPGSASFVRSAICQQSGGRTQLASIFASLLVLGVLALTSGLINSIPIATLAAYLILVSIRLVNFAQVRIVTNATRSDAIVFWLTFASALFLQLDTAVYVGIGTSLVLFLKKASAPSLVEYGFNSQGQLSQLEESKERGDAAISIVHVEGELFFGAADLFQDQVRYLAEDGGIRVIILRMKNARHLDATSVMSLLQLHEALGKAGRHLLISGINPDVERVLRRSGAWAVVGAENIFPAEANLTMSTKRALQRAKALLKQDGATGKADVRIYYERSCADKQNEASGRAESADYVGHYDI